jgi:hypothetical protein
MDKTFCDLVAGLDSTLLASLLDKAKAKDMCLDVHLINNKRNQKHVYEIVKPLIEEVFKDVLKPGDLTIGGFAITLRRQTDGVVVGTILGDWTYTGMMLKMHAVQLSMRCQGLGRLLYQACDVVIGYLAASVLPISQSVRKRGTVTVCTSLKVNAPPYLKQLVLALGFQCTTRGDTELSFEKRVSIAVKQAD